MSRSASRLHALSRQFVQSSKPAAAHTAQSVGQTAIRSSSTIPKDYKFQGWLGLDKESVQGKMVWQEYEPKPFEETDVDIKITHCGICGSDLHTLRSGWSKADYPVW